MSPKQGRYLARSSQVPAISNAIRHVAIGLRRSLGPDVFSLPTVEPFEYQFTGQWSLYLFSVRRGYTKHNT
jgi:hypothetical protein